MLTALCLSLVPQGHASEPWFTLHRRQDGAGVLVSSQRSGVAAGEALRRLGALLGWKVAAGSASVERTLGLVSLDLAFREEPPRDVARLIAAASGLDVVFDGGDGAPTVRVVAAASAGSTAGRARLRESAMHWYRRVLADPAYAGEHGPEALMHLGALLVAGGELEDAVSVYDRLFEADESQVFVPLSLLRLAEVHQALARKLDLPAEQRRAHLQLAEGAARKLVLMEPRSGLAAQGAVLLGRIMLEAGRFDECIAALEPQCARLAGTPQEIDVRLVIAACRLHGGAPDVALRELESLGARHGEERWSRGQWLDYHYLAGLGAEARGRALPDPAQRVAGFSAAAAALERFLGCGEADGRRRQALVALGRVYLELGTFVQARAAAVEALRDTAGLAPDWVEAAHVLEARTALALGDAAAVFGRLEAAVREEPGRMPRLSLFLAGSLAQAGEFDRAIAVADLLAGTGGPHRDAALVQRLRAMRGRAGDPAALQAFAAAATGIAARIEDTGHQRTAAELIGAARATLGMVEQAAAVDEGASLRDLYFLARGHVAAQDRARQQAREAQDHVAAAGADRAAVHAQRARERQGVAAEHYDTARRLLVTIEGRDVQDGAAGPWATAARSARSAMEWFAQKQAWTPPPIDWTVR